MDSKLSQILGGGRRVQVYINHDISKGRTWTQSVFFPFKPRQCIVRRIVFTVDPERSTDAYLLRGISLDNTVLGITHAIRVPVEPGIVVDLADKHVGATLQFQLQGLDGSVVTANTGVVACILEFLE